MHAPNATSAPFHAEIRTQVLVHIYLALLCTRGAPVATVARSLLHSDAPLVLHLLYHCESPSASDIDWMRAWGFELLACVLARQSGYVLHKPLPGLLSAMCALSLAIQCRTITAILYCCACCRAASGAWPAKWGLPACSSALLRRRCLGLRATASALRVLLQYAAYKRRMRSVCNPCHAVEAIAHMCAAGASQQRVPVLDTGLLQQLAGRESGSDAVLILRWQRCNAVEVAIHICQITASQVWIYPTALLLVVCGSLLEFVRRSMACDQCLRNHLCQAHAAE